MNEIQHGLLSMMVDLDEFFRKNNIEYYAEGGTAIGAVRHKGFIPWDDDMDIIISKRDEKKFVEAIKDFNGYYLQEPYSVDWPYLFYKVRKKGTTAIEDKFRHARFSQGLFIDVFILDTYPDTWFRKKLYNGFMDTVHIFQTVYEKMSHTRFADLSSRILFPSIKILDKMSIFVTNKDSKLVVEKFYLFKHYIYPKKCFEKTVYLPFEDSEICLCSEYDEMLKIQFGDYMQLPPEKERHSNHISDFSMSIDYLDYIKHNGKVD